VIREMIPEIPRRGEEGDRPRPPRLEAAFGLCTPFRPFLGCGMPALAMTRALTPRESQVLVEVALNGGTDAELAERLGMSTGTVRSHLGHLRAKLGVHQQQGPRGCILEGS